MKLHLGTALFLMVAFAGALAAEPRTIQSEVARATVFFQGAQITRTAQVALIAGTNHLVFTGLPADTDPLGIQLQATGGITIHSVNFRRNALTRPDVSLEARLLEDSLRFYRSRVNTNRAMIDVYQQEEALLAANRAIGSTTHGVDINELRSAADFLRQRLSDNKTKSLALNEQISSDQERITRILHQLARLNVQLRGEVGELVAVIEATAPVRSSIEITYFTGKAGWVPNYDLRVVDVGKNIDMLLKASVFQTTGEDWDNIRLAFSSGNPRQNNQLPELSRWFLDFDPALEEVAVVGYGVEQARITLRGTNVVAAEEAPQAFKDAEERAQTAADLVESVQGLTARTFEIAIPFSISSGGEPGLIELEKNSLPALFEYYAVPKLDPGVFLVAKVAGWQQYAFLSGEANIYMQGTYLGKTTINPATVLDTLKISLGRDPNIVVTRQRDLAFTERRLIGGRITENVGWGISLRNNNNIPVVVNIQDQLPVSTQEVIEVRTRELSGGSLVAETGFVNWTLNLAPASTQNLMFQYSVQYPRGRSVTLE
ncbi:MAG TPA: DUF4139 domain-containing protein [Bacteroidales bacterium]|nr:DUF4139 domain-containing protein [Bacteroidales bacterium]